MKVAIGYLRVRRAGSALKSGARQPRSSFALGRLLSRTSLKPAGHCAGAPVWVLGLALLSYFRL